METVICGHEVLRDVSQLAPASPTGARANLAGVTHTYLPCIYTRILERRTRSKASVCIRIHSQAQTRPEAYSGTAGNRW